MGKLLVQTSLTSGLEVVYSEIFSFDGCEVYFYENQTIGNLSSFMPQAISLKTVFRLGFIVRKKAFNYVQPRVLYCQPGDQMLILANDDSTIQLEAVPFFQAQDLSLNGGRIEQQQKKDFDFGLA